MKKIVLPLFFLSAIILCSCHENSAKTAERERSVSVRGSGQVVLEPDSVTIVFSVTSESWDVNTATQDAANRMAAVLKAFSDNGVKENDVSTFDYKIQQQIAYTAEKKRYRNYTVKNKVRVVLNDVTLAGKLIDAAVAAGANELTSLSYNVKDDTEAVKQARMLAVKQAEDTAQMLAGATGAKLGKILTINEYSSGMPYMESASLKVNRMNIAAEPQFEETSLPAGTKIVSVQVDCVYELE